MRLLPVFSMAIIFVGAGVAPAQVAPAPGDIVLIEVHADTPDRVAFVTLRDNLDLRGLIMTDQSWENDGGFADNSEGTYTFPNDASLNGVPNGTVVRLQAGSGTDDTVPFATDADPILLFFPGGTGNVQLGASGDQVFLVSAGTTIDSNTSQSAVLAGLAYENNWRTSGLADANNSYEPGTPGAIFQECGAGFFDNVWYTGISTGTGPAIQAAIADTGNNWTFNSGSQSGFNTPENFGPSSEVPVELDGFLVH